MRRSLRLIGLAAVLAVGGWAEAPAWAQAPPLVTDRPDQTESSLVVPPGSVQIETGVAHARRQESGVDVETTVVGSTLVRVGLVERLELRLGWGGYVDETVEVGGFGGGASGASDVDVGAKLRLADESGRRPALALLAAAALPVGEDEVSSGHTDPKLLLAASHALTDGVGLGYNVGAAWSTAPDALGDRDTTYSWLYSLSVGFGIDDRLSAFGEVFGSVPGNAGGESEASLDGGLTYLLRPSRQLDLSAGFAVSGGAADWFVGVGFSIRLPE